MSKKKLGGIKETRTMRINFFTPKFQKFAEESEGWFTTVDVVYALGIDPDEVDEIGKNLVAQGSLVMREYKNRANSYCNQTSAHVV